MSTCTTCKRPILEHEVDESKGVGYCYGCNHYFILGELIDRKRKEIVIPNGTSFIRLRIEEESMEIVINWFKNYSLKNLILELLDQDEKAIISFIAYLFNKTVVKVENKILEIKHKPLELLPYVYYRSSYVRQLYVKKIGRIFKTYGLFAQLSDGNEEMLIWDLDKNILLFIEQEIERIFGIEDVKLEKEIVE